MYFFELGGLVYRVIGTGQSLLGLAFFLQVNKLLAIERLKECEVGHVLKNDIALHGSNQPSEQFLEAVLLGMLAKQVEDHRTLLDEPEKGLAEGHLLVERPLSAPLGGLEQPLQGVLQQAGRVCLANVTVDLRDPLTQVSAVCSLELDCSLGLLQGEHLALFVGLAYLRLLLLHLNKG
jgi:hypothetical protein